ncbi:MAG: DUF1592 domain-containing protein [Verrucomicrobiota bacterium]
MIRIFILQLLISATAFSATDFYKDIEPILLDYCFDCHGDGAVKGDFELDNYEQLSDHLSDIELWRTVWEHTRTELMPPANKPQPSGEERAKLISWIETDIFKIDRENPDPGRVTVRRLNRLEYQNTIKDVLGLDFKANEAFPPDDTGYGFDNIGDVLSISPLLMEKYLDAARDIVRKTVNTSGPIIPTSHHGADQFVSEKKRKANWIPFERPEKFVKKIHREHPGEYRVEVDYRINGAENDTSNEAVLLVSVNGSEVLKKVLAWGDTQVVKLTRKAQFEKGENIVELELKLTEPAKEGEKKLNLQPQVVRLHGPLDGSHKVFPSDYNRVFVDGPPGEDREAYLRKLVQHWGLRLWRRPVNKRDEDRFVALAGGLDGPNQQFEKAFANVLTAMLASPKFLFRSESQPDPDNPGKVVPVDEYALASRLSYFLWQSSPDQQLLDLAAKGELRKNLRPQVDRMIGEWQKAQRFTRSFTGQWLQTRDLDLINVDPRRILGIKDRNEAEKYYNYRTKDAMRRETEEMFWYIVSHNQPALDLLTPGYTFLNEDLAFAYGIKGVKGRDMRKVDLPPDSPRGGILGQGTFLVITSNPSRTSPVKRGLFVLENLLATPAPPAPAEVPTVEEQQRKGDNRNLTMRQLMKVHAENKLCASCHARFDPIGFALENFNAIGGWREEEKGKPIEAGGELITGEPFADAKELSRVLANERRTDFYRCLVEKMLTYALGRGVEYYDSPTIDEIVQQLHEDDGKMRTLIYGIVESAPFQKRRGDGDRLAH